MLKMLVYAIIKERQRSSSAFNLIGLSESNHRTRKHNAVSVYCTHSATVSGNNLEGVT